MEQITLDLNLSGAFGNLYRDRHVLLIVVDKEGKILLGEKPDLYPAGISRLLGGGVDSEETFKQAAVREAGEEIGLTINEFDLEDVAEITVNAKTPEREFKLVTAMFYLKTDQDLTAGDDVSSFAKLTLEELYELATRYESFAPDDRFVKGEYSHNWIDYGKVYGPIHRIAGDYVKSISK